MRLNLGTLRQEHDRFLQAHSAMVERTLEEAGDVVQANVWEHPGFKPHTHETQEATTTKVVRTKGGKILRVKNSKARARYLEEGTQPHWIFPHKKRFLRFRTRDGRWVSTKAVKHPGTKPYWFLRNATQAGHRSAERLLVLGMQRIARDFGR